MRKITVNDFSGGIQESYAPDDFTERQWTQLKGIVPYSDIRFESQWPAQQIGANATTWNDNITGSVNTSPVNAIFPLQSSVGAFLVAIKADGTVWWVKDAADTEVANTSNVAVWRRLNLAQNTGWLNANTTQPTISITLNPDFRFVTGLPFEVYKYVKQPYTGRLNQPESDEVADTTVSPRSVVSGVLIHSRRYVNSSGTAVLASGVTAATQQALVVYVDPTADSSSQVKVVTFPNLRRWPQYTTDTSKVTGTYVPVVPFVSTTKKAAGTASTIIDQYPFSSSPTGYPRSANIFHPYTYLDGTSTLQPGTGFIPRGNIGTMWGLNLILGDVEYNSESAVTSISSALTPGANQALIGTSANPVILRDGNTQPHRSYIYYSERDIDTFDPRSNLRIAGTDTRLVGMYNINNRLVCITTAGGDSDGVIAISGNISQLHSYDPTVTSNPFAIRKQVIQGGVGPADYPETGSGHIQQTCFWSEVNVAAFIDRLGGVFTTNGQTCDRIDRFGPRQPRGSAYTDHVASVGKHLMAWRSGRLMVFTILNAGTQQAEGCWTELVTPIVPYTVTNKARFANVSTLTIGTHNYVAGDAIEVSGLGSGFDGHYVVFGADLTSVTYLNAGADISSTAATGQIFADKDIKSMVGSGRNLYMVVQGNVWRYAVDGPAAERGAINGVYKDLTISTASFGAPSDFNKLSWHRFGIGFYTETSCAVQSITINAGPALESAGKVPVYNAVTTPRSYTEGYNTLVVPTGIGSKNIISATYVMQGQFVLESASFWYTGVTMERD